jgi:hypothetical protein
MRPFNFVVQATMRPFTFAVLINNCSVQMHADISERNLAREEVVGVPLLNRSIYCRSVFSFSWYKLR